MVFQIMGQNGNRKIKTKIHRDEVMNEGLAPPPEGMRVLAQMIAERISQDNAQEQ